jgi:hypothetical protein
MSVQDSAEASQKFTCPGDTPTVPAFTVAASSTSVPDDTDPSDTTVLAAEKIVSAVVVAVDAQAEGKHPPTTIKNSAETRTRQETFAFKRFSNFVLLKILAVRDSNLELRKCHFRQIAAGLLPRFGRESACASTTLSTRIAQRVSRSYFSCHMFVRTRPPHFCVQKPAGRLGQKLVSCAVNCSQMNRSRWILFQLLAKLGNLVIDRAGGRVIVISPDFIQQLVS